MSAIVTLLGFGAGWLAAVIVHRWDVHSGDTIRDPAPWAKPH